MILDDATEKSGEGEQQRRQSGLKSGGRGSGSKNFDFYRQISEKFRFFQAILQKNIEFSRQISENFDFVRQFKKIDFPSKNWPFTATSGQIILLLLKSHHFRIYFLYIIGLRYNNISRPVHDPSDPAATLPATTHNPLPKIWRVARSRLPIPPGLTLLDSNGKEACSRRKELPRGGLRRMKMSQEKNGENTDLECDIVLYRNKDSEKGGHHKIGSPLKCGYGVG